jgi:hypothetical protein
VPVAPIRPPAGGEIPHARARCSYSKISPRRELGDSLLPKSPLPASTRQILLLVAQRSRRDAAEEETASALRQVAEADGAGPAGASWRRRAAGGAADMAQPTRMYAPPPSIPSPSLLGSALDFSSWLDVDASCQHIIWP